MEKSLSFHLCVILPLVNANMLELIELDDELIEDLMVAQLSHEDSTHIAEVTSIMDKEDNDVDDLIAM